MLSAAVPMDPVYPLHIGWVVIVWRLVVASALGAAVGLERQTHGRAAGLRTMLLVSLGCCLIMLASNFFAEAYWPVRVDGNNILRIDPARLAYGVMAGIGFLGAGAILKSGFSIRGLTTAATIWCIAAVGLATGLGLYFAAIVTTLLILFALLALDRVEAALETHWYKTIEVVLPDEPGIIERFHKKIERHAARVQDMQLERRADGTIKACFGMRLPDRKLMIPFFEAICREPEIQSIQMR